MRNHGGGFLNHRLFWESMQPAGGPATFAALRDDTGQPSSHLAAAAEHVRMREGDAGPVPGPALHARACSFFAESGGRERTKGGGGGRTRMDSDLAALAASDECRLALRLSGGPGRIRAGPAQQRA